MPRVANQPRTIGGPQSSPEKQSLLNIPLNNDRQEKAIRFQSRQLLYDMHLNQIKAAASPSRSTNHNGGALDATRNSQAQSTGKAVDDSFLAVVGGAAMTPIKRIPILANFEEWMKMATDNKINATNSWNFALIDYFHDMSLLKEGDSVNFQKASCTLDGCVKIYTSRVDSVATETGKLLSGLADSGNKRPQRGETGVDFDEDRVDEEEDDVSKKRIKRKTQRSSEATLAPSFTALQLKKFDLEFTIDPLFKKAAADFDEGGAKGLLLNHLGTDSHGRVVFDSSDDLDLIEWDVDITRTLSTGNEFHVGTSIQHRNTPCFEIEQPVGTGIGVDLVVLGSKFFPDLASLDNMDLCPSLKHFNLEDPLRLLHTPTFTALEEHGGDAITMTSYDKSGYFLDDDDGFDEDDGVLQADTRLIVDTGFGEGGEEWAKQAVLHLSETIDHDAGTGSKDVEGKVSECIFQAQPNEMTNDPFRVSFKRERTLGKYEDILSYFDHALKKSWAGPEHWRIRRVKDTTKRTIPAYSKRKEKEPFEVDFWSSLDPVLAGTLSNLAMSNSTISLPKTQWRSRSRNLLPDDKHFSSQQLRRLFLKPTARIGTTDSISDGHRSHPSKRNGSNTAGIDLDEQFWACQENVTKRGSLETDAVCGRYDADFFQDDAMPFGGASIGDEDDIFMDAREAHVPQGTGSVDTLRNGELGDPAISESHNQVTLESQFVAQHKRSRPEYVQYAKVAKKVDVRRLKEELWKGITSKKDTSPAPDAASVPVETKQDVLKFTTLMNSLQDVYPQKAMADISTSFCFICLLHLANEEGLNLGHEASLTELNICRDLTAVTEIYN